MAYLVDTSVLMRLVNQSDPEYFNTIRTIQTLRANGEILSVAPQNLVEFRNAGTRSIELNGLALSPEIADRQVAEFESLFRLLPETPDIYPAWKALVQSGRVIGKQVHDVRLVAVCQINRVDRILTYNIRHFARFAEMVAGLSVIDPASV